MSFDSTRTLSPLPHGMPRGLWSAWGLRFAVHSHFPQPVQQDTQQETFLCQRLLTNCSFHEVTVGQGGYTWADNSKPSSDAPRKACYASPSIRQCHLVVAFMLMLDSARNHLSATAFRYSGYRLSR